MEKQTSKDHANIRTYRSGIRPLSLISSVLVSTHWKPNWNKTLNMLNERFGINNKKNIKRTVENAKIKRDLNIWQIS